MCSDELPRKKTDPQVEGSGQVIHPLGGEIFDDFLPGEMREKNGYPLVGIKLNNQTLSLQHRVDINGDLSTIYLNDREGLRIYRQSLSFLTEMAFNRLYPGET